MKKQEHKIVDQLLFCLDDYVSVLPKDKQELLNIVKEIPLDNTVFLTDSNLAWDKKRILTEIKLLPENSWKSLIAKLEIQQKQNKENNRLGSQLQDILKTKFPNKDIYVKEFVKYDESYYVIKMYTSENTYLFDYDGPFDELVDDLIYTLKKE